MSIHHNYPATKESGFQATKPASTQVLTYEDLIDCIQHEKLQLSGITQNMLEHYCNIGGYLIELKKHCPYGRWKSTLSQLGISETRALRYRQLYEGWGKLMGDSSHSLEKALEIIHAPEDEDKDKQLQGQTIDTTAEDVTDQPTPRPQLPMSDPTPGSPAHRMQQSRTTPRVTRHRLDTPLVNYNTLHRTSITVDDLRNPVAAGLDNRTIAQLWQYLTYSCGFTPAKLIDLLENTYLSDAFFATGATFRAKRHRPAISNPNNREGSYNNDHFEVVLPGDETPVEPVTAFAPPSSAEEATTITTPGSGSAGLLEAEVSHVAPQSPAAPGSQADSPAFGSHPDMPNGATENEALHKLIEQLQAQITTLTERNEQLENELAKAATVAPKPQPQAFSILGAGEPQEPPQATPETTDDNSSTFTDKDIIWMLEGQVKTLEGKLKAATSELNRLKQSQGQARNAAMTQIKSLTDQLEESKILYRQLQAAEPDRVKMADLNRENAELTTKVQQLDYLVKQYREEVDHLRAKQPNTRIPYSSGGPIRIETAQSLSKQAPAG